MNYGGFLRLSALAVTLVGCVAAGEPVAVPTPPPAAQAAAAAPLDPEEAEAVIFERQQIMQQLNRDSETLGMIVAGLAPRDQLGPVARAVARGAAEAEASFVPQVPGGRSKPEVWANQEDFARRMAEFARRSDQMAVLAEADNMNGVLESLSDAMPCKSCHDIYRGPRQPAAQANP